MQKTDKHNLPCDPDLLIRANSFAEFAINFFLVKGRNLNKSDIDKIFRHVSAVIVILDYSTRPDDVERRNKYTSLLNEMIIDLDFIDEDNIRDIATHMCHHVLDSRNKKPFMESFKFLCGKFPAEMKREYEKQKIFKSFSV